MPVENCTKAVDGVLADGGKLVDRDAVYSKPRPAKGHYIALAIKPVGKGEASGDFHFWRLDANGVWSYKVRRGAARGVLGGALFRGGKEGGRAACCCLRCRLRCRFDAAPRHNSARLPLTPLPSTHALSLPHANRSPPPNPKQTTAYLIARQAGDTLVRNTLRNGRPIRDIERDAAARGEYTTFCGYFHVVPDKHKLVGNEVRC